MEERQARQPIRNVPNLTLQAMLSEVERLFDWKLELIQERLDLVEERACRRRTPQSPSRNRGRQQFNEDEPLELSGAESDEGSNLSIPPFQSKSDPEAYLEWEKMIELVFDCHNYSENKKAKLAAIEFSDYAMIWWDQFTTSRRRNGEKPITTRAEMNATMRRRWGQGVSKSFPSNQTKESMMMPKTNKPLAESSKRKAIESSSNRSRDIKCFKCFGRGHIASQCPNQNTMILHADGEIETEDEEEDEVELNSDEEEDLEHPVEGELLVIKRNSGSCTNVASTFMVEKLGLPTTKHSSPYKLQWLNDGGELKVVKQVLVTLKIGKYSDEVLCDVVPMHAGHLLLGRPWQFDRRVVHDGYTNRYTFKHCGKNVTLTPLTPKQVCEDQIKLKTSVGQMQEKEKKSASRKRRKIRELEEFEDVFLDEMPSGLPPIRGIEHQIDLVPRAALPNRPAYQTNPEETKELQKQFAELMDKGYIRESLSPCAVPVLLVPKKDGSWRIIGAQMKEQDLVEFFIPLLKVAGWGGSAHDSRILSDALSRPRGLRISEGKYYLVDARFAIRNGYITPYRGVRYYLKEFSAQGPEDVKELFNLRHSSLRITVERVFGILKKRFRVLDAEPFWNFQTQVDIVLACCIIHNHIMGVDPSDLLNQGLYEEPESDLIIPTLMEREEKEEAREWSAKRDEIAQTMWTNYMVRNIRMGKGNKEGTSKQFWWTKPMEHLFLEILAEEAQRGNKSSNTFKAVSINRVAEAISERFEVQCDAKHVENHLRTIKNQWQIICTIRDMATGSFARTFADIDLDDGNQDSMPIDCGNEETEEVRTHVSSSGTSKRKRKNVQESAVDEQIKFVGEQLGKIANALQQFTTDKTQCLYEEVMSMEEEGFDDDFLCAVFDYLVNHESEAKAFLVKSKKHKKIWL
ncbi:hypothetical protein GOBAR_DD33791 [Gossypium barbadense]|nr:hypothetical protein GOBAR_DD33791 [Gossypium barbadense]